MSDANPFALETQIEAALQGKWGAHKRAKRRKKLLEQLRELLPRVDAAEADFRRAFKRWDKYRARCNRIERELDKLYLLDEESANEVAASESKN